MYKKILAVLLAGILLMCISLGALASEMVTSENVTPDETKSNMLTPEGFDGLNSKENFDDETNTESSNELESKKYDEQSVDSSPIESNSIELLGSQNLSDASKIFKDNVETDKSKINLSGKNLDVPKQRTGNVIENANGVLSGRITNENPFDFYVFSSSTTLNAFSKLVTDNSAYTLTVGFVDFQSGSIALTNLAVSANQPLIFDYEPLDNPNVYYAWVVQSSNGTLGDDYKLQYNMALNDFKNDNVLAISDDFQKIYTFNDNKLEINHNRQNIDYKYYLHWEIPPVGAGDLHWNTLKVYMENANVSVAYVGGCQYYASESLYQFPNSIVFKVLPGGWFTHYFSQNPPYINKGEYDAAGLKTPREITYEDLEKRGSHYLIYDMNTDKVVEFASGLTKPWSSLGDKHSLSTY